MAKPLLVRIRMMEEQVRELQLVVGVQRENEHPSTEGEQPDQQTLEEMNNLRTELEKDKKLSIKLEDAIKEIDNLRTELEKEKELRIQLESDVKKMRGTQQPSTGGEQPGLRQALEELSRLKTELKNEKDEFRKTKDELKKEREKEQHDLRQALEELQKLRAELQEEKELRVQLENNGKEMRQTEHPRSEGEQPDLRQALEELRTELKEEKVEQNKMMEDMFMTLNNNRAKSLITAARIGNVWGVKLLLECENATNYDNGTPLHSAAAAGHVEVVRLLIAKRFSVYAIDTSKHTALHSAAANGHAQVCRILIDAKAPVDESDDCGYTPLILAAQKGSLDTCKLLISYGANVNALRHYDSSSALHFAARGNHTDVCKLLLKSNCNVNQCDKDKYTPLHTAAGNGCLSAVKLLVEHGADTSAKIKRNCDTALTVAAKSGKTEVVKYLAELDASKQLTT